MKKLEEYVRSIPDFPEPGIIFRDITTIILDPDGLLMAVIAFPSLPQISVFSSSALAAILAPNSRMMPTMLLNMPAATA